MIRYSFDITLKEMKCYAGLIVRHMLNFAFHGLNQFFCYQRNIKTTSFVFDEHQNYEKVTRKCYLAGFILQQPMALRVDQDT